jgi:hypothetical protein
MKKTILFTGLLAGWLALPASAQSGPKPTWLTATALGTGASFDNGIVGGVAADASGNLLVVGTFSGTLTLGSTTLTSAGYQDIFLAKYLTATDTWAWAVRAGGLNYDYGASVAVRGSSIYVVGSVSNNSRNYGNVLFGSTAQYGIGYNTNFDVVLAKYTDQGSSAAFNWVQAAGGTGYDQGFGVAVSATGTSVYVTGALVNNQANDNAVVFGASGTTVGTSVQAGAATGSVGGDMFVAKYTDNGPSGSFNWCQVGGGSGFDQGYGLAVSGSSVYVTGSLTNTSTNAQGVLFGGTGTTIGTAPQYGASATSSPDLLLAKYTDNGATSNFNWCQVGGGTSSDQGRALAVSGSSVYVTGYLINDVTDYAQVRFGGSGMAAGTVAQAGTTSGLQTYDLVLAKYVDNGPTASVAWTQVGGGSGYDSGQAVAVSGNRVYVTGYLENNAANANAAVFGGSGLVRGTAPQAGAGAGASYDLVAASYVDNGPSASLAWTQVGGGTGTDQGTTAVVVGTRLYLGGSVAPVATFGSLTISTPTGVIVPLLSSLSLAGTLAATPALVAAAPQLWPNPTLGPATLKGASPGQLVQVYDALGRLTLCTKADATGAASLTLPAGLYLVRAGAAPALRLTVE